MPNRRSRTDRPRGDELILDTPDETTLLDMLDKLLNKGVALHGDIVLGVAGVAPWIACRRRPPALRSGVITADRANSDRHDEAKGRASPLTKDKEPKAQTAAQIGTGVDRHSLSDRPSAARTPEEAREARGNAMEPRRG